MNSEQITKSKEQNPIGRLRRPQNFLIFFFVLTILISAGNYAWAHDPNSGNDFWRPGEPLVPCGTTTDQDPDPGQYNNTAVICDRCQLLHLVRHVIDFLLIVAAPVLATLFFVWAGVLIMLGGANPGMLTQGKRIFKDTIIGLIVIMLAWLITNTLIKSLAKDTIYTGDDASTPIELNKWWQFSCPQLLGGN